MRFSSSLLTAALLLLPAFSNAQDESSRKIAGGGITVPGWTGKVDASETKAGKTINDAKFDQEGKAIHVVTGPEATYWNPANKASGDYTVKATFNEPKFQNLNSHPHPYGIVIGGTGLGNRRRKLPLLRRLRQRQFHRPRLRPRGLSNERPPRRNQRRRP